MTAKDNICLGLLIRWWRCTRNFCLQCTENK